MKTSKTKTIVIATAITTLLSATAVYAATTNNGSVHVPMFSRTHTGAAKDGFINHLDSLVTAGTITSDQETAIQNAISTEMKTGIAKGEFKQGMAKGFKTALDGLVTGGTITSDQETAIEAAVTKYRKTGMAKGEFKQGPANKFKTALDTLVKNGTITQDQEDTIFSK